MNLALDPVRRLAEVEYALNGIAGNQKGETEQTPCVIPVIFEAESGSPATRRR